MELDVVDIGVWLNRHTLEAGDPAVERLCRQVSDTLRETGVLVVRDPRVSYADNAAFLDMMELYFSQSHEAKMKDVRAELHYQVGATPELVEVPRCKMDPRCAEDVALQPKEHRATLPTGADPKWRYMWRVGPRPPASATSFVELNAEPVVPEAFPQWELTMNQWGKHMTSTVEAVAEMAALGFGLPQTSISELMLKGPHLLAPTGSDLSKYVEPNTVFAGFHYDLNLLTIHGKSRFPGLFVWLRDGRRVAVVVPDGCLLLQAGKQLEWLTGGHVRAGMHEVVLSPAASRAAEEAKKDGRSTWRVSSTLFAHVASDQILQPLGYFANEALAADYPPTPAGKQVESELSVLQLKADTSPHH